MRTRKCRSRQEPGKFIPFEVVKEMLKQEYYGADDLVKIGLFHEVHHVQTAMRKEELPYNRVNRETTFMTRDQVLAYWQQYRSKPFENATNKVTFYCTPTEANEMQDMVEKVRKKLNSKFTTEDLLRNSIKYISEGIAKGSLTYSDNRFFKTI